MFWSMFVCEYIYFGENFLLYMRLMGHTFVLSSIPNCCKSFKLISLRKKSFSYKKPPKYVYLINT